MLVQNYMSDTWENIRLFHNFLTARLVTSIEKHQQRWALDLGLQIILLNGKLVTEAIILAL